MSGKLIHLTEDTLHAIRYHVEDLYGRKLTGEALNAGGIGGYWYYVVHEGGAVLSRHRKLAVAVRRCNRENDALRKAAKGGRR